MNHSFGEKKTENIKGVECPVWQTPKYEISRNKAIEMIESGKFGLADGDFWILMNTFSGGKKVMYTGLIVSHNGCLKINSKMEYSKQFHAKYVSGPTLMPDGTVVFTYNDGELFEVGEASPKNCSISYLYSMAKKRLEDRVILKLSGISYYGFYSEVEAEEFKPTEIRDFKNPEVLEKTYLSFMDDFIFKFPQYKKSIFENYGLKQIEDIKTLAPEVIDEMLTKAKGIIGGVK